MSDIKTQADAYETLLFISRAFSQMYFNNR